MLLQVAFISDLVYCNQPLIFQFCLLNSSPHRGQAHLLKNTVRIMPLACSKPSGGIFLYLEWNSKASLWPLKPCVIRPLTISPINFTLYFYLFSLFQLSWLSFPRIHWACLHFQVFLNCCSFCLEYSSSRSSHGWFFLVTPVSAQMSIPRWGAP